MKLNFNDNQSCRAYLDSLPEYQVLEKINPNQIIFNENLGSEPIKKAIYLDCESTGLDFDSDKVIELGMITFSYGVTSGRIYKIENQLSQLEDPGFALSEEIIQITGIKDEDLKDKQFNDTEIEEKLSEVSLVIAHNAHFDRNMLEKRFDAFKNIPWACSQLDINWKEIGLTGVKLEYLLFKFGYFYSGHRAVIDCFAGLNLLNQNLAKVSDIEGNVMNLLLKKARSKSYIIKALQAPFASKDDLKKRGYRWNPESANSQKSWWIEVSDDSYQAELNWLSKYVYQSETPLKLHNIEGAITSITAKQRHRKI